MRVSFLAAASILVAALGCGGDDGAESVPEPEASTLTSINATIFLPKCTHACHSGGEFAAGGLDMESDPRGAMLDVAATAVVCAGTGQKRLVPGDPEASLLYTKVAAKAEGKAPPCGDAMPQGETRPALSAAEQERIRAWIADGALAD